MPTKIYFSDFFDLQPETLENYGAFNISLINDLPVFIDPFLLFDSDNDNYKRLHEEIIRYVKFLKSIASEESINQGLLDSWFKFPEVSQNWLGFSKTGNKGNGLGKEFAEKLHKNLHRVFRDFGNEQVSRGSHLEKLCLLSNGVGRDHLSDFVTNLIKQYLLEYTQKFAQNYLQQSMRKRVAIDKVFFDYSARRWKGAHYELPYYNNDFVLLTPRDILTKDEAWINRTDLVNNFSQIYTAMPNEQLRAQVDEYFLRSLSDDSGKEEIRKAASATLEKFPEILDHYIKHKEESGPDAHRLSSTKVREAEVQFIDNIRDLVDGSLSGTEFYELGDSFEESLRRLHFLKTVIENGDGHRIFFVGGAPIQREEDLQIMYRLTWFATAYDVNREVNNGRGPVDFKVSKGSRDKTLIEFKLASNSKLKQNLKHQVGVYEAANNTAKSIKAILHFSHSEYLKVKKVLTELGLTGRRDVVLIDASIKTSASNVKDPVQGHLDL